MRLISPITGPAHHTAARQGCRTPTAARTDRRRGRRARATPTATWVSGPASEMASVHGREQRPVGVVRGEPGHELQRDRCLGAGSPGDDGVGEFMDQRERGDRAGQPPAELATVVEERQQDHEDDEPGADVHREPEQPEQRLGASGHERGQRTGRSYGGARARTLSCRAIRLRLRSQAPPSSDGDEGPPGWQGRQPRRDDERAQAAGSRRLHDLHRRLPRLSGGRMAERSSTPRSPSRSAPSRRRWVAASAIPPTRCWSACGRVPSSRCPG